MTTLVRHLYRQVMRKGRVIGLTVLVATLGLILWLTSIDSNISGDIDNFHGTVIAGGIVFTLALLILAVAVLRDEKDGGTLPFLYMRPIPRGQFALGAMATGILASVTLAVIAWVITALGAVGGKIPFADTLPALALFVVAAVGYAGIFVPLGYLAPRALLVGLVYVIIIESIMAQAVPSFGELSVWRISVSVYAGLIGDLPDWLAATYLEPMVPGVGGGLIKIAIVVLLGWGVLTWALKERDAV